MGRGDARGAGEEKMITALFGGPLYEYVFEYPVPFYCRSYKNPVCQYQCPATSLEDARRFMERDCKLAGLRDVFNKEVEVKKFVLRKPYNPVWPLPPERPRINPVWPA